MCRRKTEMTPGAQSRNDTPSAADRASATRHVSPLLGTGDGVKGQTTVPKAIRQALGVGYGGRIAFRVEGNTVSVHAVTEPEQDPALAPFLALLERNIAARPNALLSFGPELAARKTEATEGVEVDPDTPIEGEVAL